MLTEAILEILAGTQSSRSAPSMMRASRRAWRKALLWMDTGGVALYFLREVETRKLTATVPDEVLERLRANRKQNDERARDLARELREIGQSFEEAGIPFLVLKGFANVPEACPDPALRLQVDLDLMVKEQHTSEVQKLLQWHGYGLTAIGNGSWEFRTQSVEVPKLKDIYAVKPERSLDMHSVPAATFDQAYAARNACEVLGVHFYSLSGVEKLLAQSAHLAKHLRGEWTRLSWLIEMQTALRYWENDSAFWEGLGSRLYSDAKALENLGVALLLCREVLGLRWENNVLCEAERTVPESLRLWIRVYGREAVKRSFPGSKLYLLIPAAKGSRRAERRQRLMPVSAPPLIVPREARNDYRLRAAWAQARFLAFRLRFHIREGARYLLAAAHWKRLLAEGEERRWVA